VIIKKVGDELFCEFSSAKQAVDSALVIQKAIQPYNDSRPKDFKLQVRIGIHVGDIVLRDGDVFGDGVNIASRIQPFASPGGICISSAVKEAVSSHPKYDIQSEGKQELKNIIEKHTLYRIKTGYESKTGIRNNYKKSRTLGKVLIGSLVIFIAGILFFGDIMNIGEIHKEYTKDNLPGVHLLYIGSPAENYGDCYTHAEYILSNNEGADLFALEELELKNLRLNIESELYSEFYNQNITIQLLKKDGEIGFVNNTLKKYSSRKKIAEKIYEFFEKPKHIIFVRVYSIKSSEGAIIQYVTNVLSGLGDRFTSITLSGGSRETIEDIESKILDEIIAHITMIINRGSGKVVKVDGDYIYINPGDLILQENMNLLGFTIWNHYDKDEDGFTDKDSSYYKWINDVNRALDYMRRSDKYTIEKINTLQRKLDYLTSDSLRSNAKGERWGSFSYSLNVIDVRDTTVIAKLIELENPWVELNVGDLVRVDF